MYGNGERLFKECRPSVSSKNEPLSTVCNKSWLNNWLGFFLMGSPDTISDKEMKRAKGERSISLQQIKSECLVYSVGKRFIFARPAVRMQQLTCMKLYLWMKSFFSVSEIPVFSWHWKVRRSFFACASISWIRESDNFKALHLHIFCKKLQRNWLLNLTTFSPFFNFPWVHSQAESAIIIQSWKEWGNRIYYFLSQPAIFPSGCPVNILKSCSRTQTLSPLLSCRINAIITWQLGLPIARLFCFLAYLPIERKQQTVESEEDWANVKTWRALWIRIWPSAKPFHKISA